MPIIVLIISILLVSCEVNEGVIEGDIVVASQHFGNPEDQQRFIAALKEHSIPFVKREFRGEEHVEWKAEYHLQVEKIKENLFGKYESNPSGRNVRFSGDTHKKFKLWLDDKGIPYTTFYSDGKEYIAWQEKYSKQVKEWSYFSPGYWERPVIE